MRVLALELGDGVVELHPFLTVVRGLSPDAREELIRVLAAVPAGKALADGVLEAHGVLLDLDDGTLELLDLGGDLDVVVRSGDLPGGQGGHARVAAARRALADAEAAAAAADVDVERAERALAAATDALAAARRAGDDPAAAADALAGSRTEVDRCAAERAAAEQALDVALAAEAAATRAVHAADADVAAARQARTDATRAVSVAAAALEAASDRRDPMAPTALEAAETALAEAEAAVAAARDDAVSVAAAAPEVPTAEEVAALRSERVAAEAAVLALDTADPFPVQMALEQLEAGGAVEPVPDPDAVALADELATVDAHLRALPPPTIPLEEAADRQAAARARRSEAEAAVAAAEIAVRGPALDPDDARALDDAHQALLDARDEPERRVRRGAVARRIAEAEAAERAALDKLGFATWTDYLMGHRGGTRDPEAPRRLEQARIELAAAIAEAEALDLAVADELRRAELLDRRRDLRARAVALLGSDPGDAVLDALRHRRVPVTETGGHLSRLRGALEAAGLALGDEDLPQRTLADLARVWLEEQQRARDERRALEERVAELDARVAEAERLRAAAAEPSSEPSSPMAAALAVADEARAAVDVARARVARHEEADAEVAERRRAFEAASQDEQAAVGAVADAEARLAAARDDERRAAAAVAMATAQVDAAAAAERAARDLLADFEARLSSDVGRVAAIEAELARASAARTEAGAVAAQAAADLVTARAALAAAEAETTAEADPDPGADVEDAEWFLLARLAGQRSVSFAGSVPLVLDDALARFDAESTRSLLARLERMAATVQVVVVTEDLDTAAWAESIGAERAAIVQR